MPVLKIITPQVVNIVKVNSLLNFVSLLMELMQNLKKSGQIHFQPPSPALLNKIMEKFGVETRSSIDSKTTEHEKEDMKPKANQQPLQSPSDTKIKKGGGFSKPHFLNQLEGEEITRKGPTTRKPLMIVQSSDPPSIQTPDPPSKVGVQIKDQITTEPNNSHQEKLMVEGKVIEPLKVVGKSTATFPSASGLFTNV